MRTPVRFGVTVGAIEVTSAAVGEVSDMQGSTRGYFPTPDCDVRFWSKADIPPQKVMSALPPKADIGQRKTKSKRDGLRDARTVHCPELVVAGG
jgi:hypothetical protein